MSEDIAYSNISFFLKEGDLVFCHGEEEEVFALVPLSEVFKVYKRPGLPCTGLYVNCSLKDFLYTEKCT